MHWSEHSVRAKYQHPNEQCMIIAAASASVQGQGRVMGLQVGTQHIAQPYICDARAVRTTYICLCATRRALLSARAARDYDQHIYVLVLFSLAWYAGTCPCYRVCTAALMMMH